MDYRELLHLFLQFKPNVDKAIGNFLEFYLNNADGKVEKRESATKLFIGR